MVETAQSNGLSLLTRKLRNPLKLDTFGVAALLRAAQKKKPNRIFVGLGGSATNDGGFGMARALGWTFRDARNEEICEWPKLNTLVRLQAPPTELRWNNLTLAVDVESPLLGPLGATRIFGPQKGLAPSDLPHAESCLSRLAEVVADKLGQDFSLVPGAGAAGGLGFGLAAFCGGSFHSGARLFSSLVELDKRIVDADLVITAEGSLDAQSFMGKGVGLVAECAERHGKPCICLAGSVQLDKEAVVPEGFQCFSIVPTITSITQAIEQPEQSLERLAQVVASNFAQQ